MKTIFFAKILICVAGCGAMLYSYIDMQTQVTAKRLALPNLLQEVDVLKEENTRLCFELERFENPSHLMELAKMQPYRHLKYVEYQETLRDTLIATNP